MTIYILTVLIVIVFGTVLKPRKESTYLTVVSLILISIIGLRSVEIGTDTRNYKLIFEVMGKKNISDYASMYGYDEILFFLFNKLIYSAGGSYQILLIIEGILTIVPTIFFVKKNASIAWLSILLYICMGNINQAMNVSRQYVALGIILIGANYAIDKKKFKFIVCILIATLFHTSAIICMSLYPLFNVHSKRFTNISVALVPVFLLFRGALVGLIGRYIPIFYFYNAGGEGNTLLALWLIMLCIIFFFYWSRDEDIEIDIALRTLSFSILFQLFISNYVVLGRMSYYFVVVFYLLLPNIVIKFVPENSRRIVFGLIMTLITVYYVAIYLPGGASQTVPYLLAAGV